MNKKTNIIRYVAMILSLAAIFALSACGAETKKESNASGEATTPAGSVGTATEPEVFVGVGDRSEFLDVEATGPEAAETTVPTEGTDPTEATKPEDPTEATEPEEESTQPAGNVGNVTYEDYMAMTGDEQSKFADSFPSVKDFVEWYNSVKEEADIPEPTVLEGDVVVVG